MTSRAVGGGDEEGATRLAGLDPKPSVTGHYLSHAAGVEEEASAVLSKVSVCVSAVSTNSGERRMTRRAGRRGTTIRLRTTLRRDVRSRVSAACCLSLLVVVDVYLRTKHHQHTTERSNTWPGVGGKPYLPHLDLACYILPN